MDTVALARIPQLLPRALSITLDHAQRRLSVTFPKIHGKGFGEESFRECELLQICKLLDELRMPYLRHPTPKGFSTFLLVPPQNPEQPVQGPSLEEVLQMPWITATISCLNSFVKITCLPNGSTCFSEFIFSCERRALIKALAIDKQPYTERSLPGGLLLFISSRP